MDGVEQLDLVFHQLLEDAEQQHIFAAEIVVDGSEIQPSLLCHRARGCRSDADFGDAMEGGENDFVFAAVDGVREAAQVE